MEMTWTGPQATVTAEGAHSSTIPSHDPSSATTFQNMTFARLEKRVLQLAQEFVVKVPKLEFSPDEIMSLLLANKQSPRQAIAIVGKWMERTREERLNLAMKEPWALDESDVFSDH